MTNCIGSERAILRATQDAATQDVTETTWRARLTEQRMLRAERRTVKIALRRLVVELNQGHHLKHPIYELPSLLG